MNTEASNLAAPRWPSQNPELWKVFWALGVRYCCPQLTALKPK